MEIKPK